MTSRKSSIFLLNRRLRGLRNRYWSPSAVQSVAQSLYPTTVYYTAEEEQRLTGPQIQTIYKAVLFSVQTCFLSYFLHREAYRFCYSYKIVVKFQARPRVLSFFQNVQTGFEAHPAIYSMVIRDSLPDQKLARTLRRPVNPCSAEVENEYSHNSTPLHTSKK